MYHVAEHYRLGIFHDNTVQIVIMNGGDPYLTVAAIDPVQDREAYQSVRDKCELVCEALNAQARSG